MNVWIWFSTNAEAVQSIAALLTMVLSAITIGVLIATWKAIKVQAEAARALTLVAVEQTNAAKAAAKSSEIQARLAADQLELTTAPLLVFEPDDRPVRFGVKLANRGLGVAFQVEYWQGGFEHLHPRPLQSYSPYTLDPSTLAPGMSVYLSIPEVWPSWTVKYRGIDDLARATTMRRGNLGGQHYIIRRGGKEITLDNFPRPNGEKTPGDWTE